jgi:hypothetical protein
MTKLTVAFRSFSNAPNNNFLRQEIVKEYQCDSFYTAAPPILCLKSIIMSRIKIYTRIYTQWCGGVWIVINFHLFLTTYWVCVVVMILVFIREIPASYLNRQVDSLHRRYLWFFSSSPCKFLDRPWPLPSKSFLIHHLPIVLLSKHYIRR